MVKLLFTKNLLLIIFIFNISFILNDYISIPFRNYQISNNMINADNKFINDYLYNNIYINMQISQPLQNIIAKINSLEFELLMKNTSNLSFENLNSNYSKEKSSTFSVISEKGDNHFPNSKFVKEKFNFCIKYDINSKKCILSKNFDNIILIYTEEVGSEEEEEKKPSKSLYIEIGLSYKSYYYYTNKNKNSLLTNLISNNYINNQNWFIYFFNKENFNNKNKEIIIEDNDEGILVFGIEPNDFFGNKYNKDNIVSCQGINTNYDYQNNWSIIFQEVKQKTLKPDNKDVVIQTNLQGVINFNYNIIVGNNHYMDIITNTFFLTYITEGVCKKQLANNKFYYFECNSQFLNLNEIKENFPSLYFKQNEFNYTFELNSQDLFIQIGQQIFFLVVFNKNNPTKSFLLGNIFLKKYFFSFENISKKILFYKENEKKGPRETEDIKEKIVLHWYNSSIFVVIMSIMIVIFCIFGFFFGKRVYQKRKIRAWELEENYSYNSSLTQKEKKYELN